MFQVNKLVHAFVIGLLFAVAGCKMTSTEGNIAFTDSCADDQLASNSVLYFGPSNHIGPGSIWSRLGSNGGYQPQWRVEDLNLDYSKVVQRGTSFQCDFSKNSTFTANAGLSVLSTVAKASGEIKSDFSRAKKINVSANKVAWDTVVAGPYILNLKGIPDPSMKSDVFGKNRLILRRALRLSGYKATLEFDSSVKPEIKAKYDGVKLGAKAVGEVGAQLAASWTNDDKLQLTAGDDVYVAGEFALLDGEGLASTKGGARGIVEDLGDKYVKPYEEVK